MRKFEKVSNRFIKYNNTEIILPKRATTHSACYDIYSPINAEIPPHDKLLIWTNVKALCNDDEAIMIYSRSSGAKYDIRLANCVGVIDSDYYSNPDNDGNIGVFIKNDGDKPYIINQGDRIAQAMFIKYFTTDNDETVNTNRTSGFGSTNK